MAETHYILCEGNPPPRGFLSNYVTILMALRELIEVHGVPESRIHVSPAMFKLYGDPAHWFVPDRLRKPPASATTALVSTKQIWLDYNVHFDFTRDAWRDGSAVSALRPHPMAGLRPYKRLFDYNDRIARYLQDSVKVFDNCLGVHFRGTDNNYGKASANHAKPVPLPAFLDRISMELESGRYEHLFVATDEDGIIERIAEHCWGRHRFDRVHHNPCTRSSTGAALHKTNFAPDLKVRLGDEILLEVHSLVGCSAVICRASNIVGYLGILNEHFDFIRLDLTDTGPAGGGGGGGASC